MRRKTDLLGKEIGYLVVIGEESTVNTLVRWRCKCICGNEIIKFANDLKRNRSTISCGCKFKESRYNKYTDVVTKSAAAIFSSNYKSDTDMSFEEFLEMTSKNCYYCNEPPSNSYCLKRLGEAQPFIYNGLDRIDSSKNHTKDNCVPSCKWCNFAKGQRTQNEFMVWIQKLSNYQIDRKNIT